MFKAVGVWTWPRPEDIEAFEEHYEGVHVALASQIPHAERVTLMKAGESGREANIYRLAEMYFADEEKFAEASASEAWAAMVADASGMIERFGVELKAANGWETDQASRSNASVLDIPTR
jgi:uncharacterized protein (TIGR02118 family)